MARGEKEKTREDRSRKWGKRGGAIGIMLVWHARNCMYCAVRTLKVNGWYLTFPAGEGKKGAVIPYFLLLPRPIRLAIRGRNTHTHTLSLPLQIPPAGLSLLAKRENSPLVPRKGPASIFSQCGQREKAFIWQQQENRTRDRNCAKLYVNQCVVLTILHFPAAWVHRGFSDDVTEVRTIQPGGDLLTDFQKDKFRYKNRAFSRKK